jgi:hypothetical protein
MRRAAVARRRSRRGAVPGPSRRHRTLRRRQAQPVDRRPRPRRGVGVWPLSRRSRPGRGVGVWPLSRRSRPGRGVGVWPLSRRSRLGRGVGVWPLSRRSRPGRRCRQGRRFRQPRRCLRERRRAVVIRRPSHRSPRVRHPPRAVLPPNRRAHRWGHRRLGSGRRSQPPRPAGRGMPPPRNRRRVPCRPTRRHRPSARAGTGRRPRCPAHRRGQPSLSARSVGGGGGPSEVTRHATGSRPPIPGRTTHGPGARLVLPRANRVPNPPGGAGAGQANRPRSRRSSGGRRTCPTGPARRPHPLCPGQPLLRCRRGRSAAHPPVPRPVTRAVPGAPAQ